MNDFPRMLYKYGGPEQIHGGCFHTRIAHDADELEAALANGWCLTTPEAKVAHEAALQSAADNAPPTREELEQKARELGLDFSPNIGDKKLAERIEAALSEKKD